MEDPLMEVISKLSLVTEVDRLEEIAGELAVEIAEADKGNRKPIFKLLMQYLTSGDLETLEDGGLGKLLKILDLLGGNPREIPKTEENLDMTGTHERPEPVPGSVHVDLNSLRVNREFKIKGSIGNPAQEGKIDYRGLAYQIKSGRERGFTEKEICAAVIGCITPGHNLRSYLEGVHGLTLKFLITVLRAHFKVKDAASVFTELSNAVQEHSETELAFCMRLMKLRQDILILSQEEECPYEVKLVQNRFQHALFTGLKNENMRNRLRTLIRSTDLNDAQLLQEISNGMINESEHSEKVNLKYNRGEVSRIEVEKSKKGYKRKIEFG